MGAAGARVGDPVRGQILARHRQESLDRGGACLVRPDVEEDSVGWEGCGRLGHD